MLTLIMLVDEGEDTFKRVALGVMDMSDIKQFIEMITEYGTDEGYSYDGVKFSIEEKAFYVYVA